MKLLLLSTCGISVLTNDTSREFRKWLNGISNETKLDDGEQKRLDDHVRLRTKEFLEADEAQQKKVSAELNSILTVLDHYGPQQVQHLLLHTDTVVGKKANEIIAKALRKRKHEVQLLSAGGLRTDDLVSFRSALSDLARQLEENWRPWRDEGWKFFFNLTGGFKSVSAYLQSYGMVRADRCVFQFERSSQVMEIPRLPVQLAGTQEVRAHLDIFRRLSAGYDVDARDAEQLPETLTDIVDGKACLSPLGDIVWAQARKKMFAEKLLPPLSSRVSFVNQNKAEGEYKGFSETNRIDVNSALDALSIHLDEGREMPKSHRLKTIEGKPHPPATHEIYISNRSARKRFRRVFGRLKNGEFIIDHIGDHL